MEISLQVQRARICDRVSPMARRKIVDVDANTATIHHRRHQFGAYVYIAQEEPRYPHSARAIAVGSLRPPSRTKEQSEQLRVFAQRAQPPERLWASKHPPALQDHSRYVFILRWRHREVPSNEGAIPVYSNAAFVVRHD
eukprot:IDg13166t1